MQHMLVNSKYANITKKGKVFIISDSITKPIDMLEFNNRLENRDAVKRAFPGATASQINHYVPMATASQINHSVPMHY